MKPPADVPFSWLGRNCMVAVTSHFDCMQEILDFRNDGNGYQVPGTASFVLEKRTKTASSCSVMTAPMLMLACWRSLSQTASNYSLAVCACEQPPVTPKEVLVKKELDIYAEVLEGNMLLCFDPRSPNAVPAHRVPVVAERLSIENKND